MLQLSYRDDGLGPGGLALVVRLRGERSFLVNDFLQVERDDGELGPTLPANQFGNTILGTQFVDDPTSNAVLERTCSASGRD
jgi:hypothetical protein